MPNTDEHAGEAQSPVEGQPGRGNGARMRHDDLMSEEERHDVTHLGSPTETFEPDEQRAFTIALQALNEAGVPYIVSGALATHHYTGIWRDSKDLDLFLAREDLDAALDTLGRQGFATEITHESWLAKAKQDPYFIDLIWSSSNKVFQVEREWIQRGNPGRVFGVPVRFISPADLLAMQVFVGERHRWDASAIQHLILCTRETINWQLLLEHMGEDHWPLLLSHLVLFQYVYPSDKDAVPGPVMCDLLDRMQRWVDQPPLEGHVCRGLYLSKVSYQVDFSDWGYTSPFER